MADPAPAEEGVAPPPTGRFSRFFKLSGLSTSLMATSALGKMRKAFSGGGAKAVAIEAETQLANAMKLLDTMGQLKGAVMKLGQVISIQEDAVPAEFRSILGKLQTQAPPMHPSYAIDIVETELKKKLPDLFADFERKPFAAASLGQVHRATLKTGEKVVVKIQYPGIEETIESDLKLAAPIVKGIALTSRAYDMREALEEVSARLREEVDYLHEAESQENIRAAFADSTDVVVPRVFMSHTSRRVITMERLEGKHLDDFAKSELDPERRRVAAEKISHAFWRMQLEFGVMHADPHPGNFLFLDDGRLGLLDFGCVKVFPDAFIKTYIRALRGIVERNEQAVLDAYADAGLLDPEYRTPEREREFLAWSHVSCYPLIEDRVFPDASRGESWSKYVQDLHDAMSRIAYKIGTYTPRDATYLNRVTLGIHCFWARLDVRTNFHRIMMPYIERAEERFGLVPPRAAPVAELASCPASPR